MEPALPPLHPKVPHLLEHLNLRIVDAVKWNVLLCADASSVKSDTLLVLKFGDNPRKAASIQYEVKLLRGVLPEIDRDQFDRLVLPEYVSDGEFEGLAYVLTKYIPGQHLIYEWSELSFKPEILGGRDIGTEVAIYAVDVLRDLRIVDVDALPSYVRRYRFEDWLAEFKVRSRELNEARLLSTETVERALKLFNSLATERYQGSMFTNGDFYPRNFIMLPKGRIAVADWVGGVDPWEFVAMHAWLMMWGNPAWQATYIREIARHFPVDLEEMQVGLLVESFNHVYRWREEPEESVGIARSQMLAYFHQSLEISYVKEIFTV